MDYSSALPSDTEHPAGTSPWATSPGPIRNSFGQAPAADAPSSPLPPQSPYTEATEQDLGFTAEVESPSSPEHSTTAERTARDDGSPSGSPQTSQPQQRRPQPEQRRQDAQRYQGTRARQNMPQHKLQAKVTGLERNGRKDPILRFDVYTNLPKFRTTQFRDVRRTHSEFVKLGEHLISSNPEAFVPAVPPPSSSAGAGTDEDEVRVKASLQRWLNTVCGNDVLMHDEEMVFFVESDFGYSPVVRRKQPATGVRRKMIKQFAPPPDDTPELAEARPIVKQFYLGAMDTGQKVDRVVKIRRALGAAESELGSKLSVMHVQETHPGLAHAYRKLGKIIQATGDFDAAQGTAEASTLSDPLTYHTADAFIVKETLTNRHILLRELMQAQQSARSKLAAVDRLKASSSVRRDKVDEAISALDEARSHESHLSAKVDRVTQNLVQERRKWFARTSADMRQAVREFVMREIEAERRALATLESVRADIRAIDASGGLSRLGREAHPAQRRATLASSQGPRGDAWSGVPRKSDSLSRSISGGITAPVPEENDEDVEESENGTHGGSGKGGRKRSVSGAGSSSGVAEDDDDRIDARNAASRLATTTF